MKTPKYLLFPLFFLLSFSPFPTRASDNPAPPQPARDEGYLTKTFSSTFSKQTIDLQQTKNPGHSWYTWDLFGKKSNPSAIQLNPDGSVTLSGDATQAQGQLVTAVKTNAHPFFVGTAFGGGAYIEAEIKFDKRAVSNAPDGAIPAFWALQTEGDIFKNEGDWTNMSKGYKHNIEIDIFEAIRNPIGIPVNSYGGSIHDWYGEYKKTCPKGLCQESLPYCEGMRIVPRETNFLEYHKYGFLWVPATKTSKGKAGFFFDGVLKGPLRTWDLYVNQPPPPNGQPWAFGILDQRHIYLILGSGLEQPMTVRSVSVWQKDARSNLINF